MNPDYKEIGKNIRLMRIRHGISQSELAQRLDVSQTHMSNLEHGRVSVSLRVLLRLAHFFKCSVDTLLGSDDFGKPQNIKSMFLQVDIIDCIVHFSQRIGDIMMAHSVSAE